MSRNETPPSGSKAPNITDLDVNVLPPGELDKRLSAPGEFKCAFCGDTFIAIGYLGIHAAMVHGQ